MWWARRNRRNCISWLRCRKLWLRGLESRSLMCKLLWCRLRRRLCRSCRQRDFGWETERCSSCVFQRLCQWRRAQMELHILIVVAARSSNGGFTRKNSKCKAEPSDSDKFIHDASRLMSLWVSGSTPLRSCTVAEGILEARTFLVLITGHRRFKPFYLHQGHPILDLKSHTISLRSNYLQALANTGCK